MDDHTTLTFEEKHVLEVIDAAAIANSRRGFEDLRNVIDAGDRLIAQQIVARSVNSEAAERVADVVAENPNAKKRWWQR